MSSTSQLISWFAEAQRYLSTTTLHKDFLPFPLLDVLGAVRLSVIIDQYIRSRNRSIRDDETGLGKRPGFVQEAFGIAVLLFGGESFLAPCLGIMPSWLQTPNTLILFWGVHYLVTRTPLNSLIPRKASLNHELPLSIHDSLGRAILLTTVSFDLVQSHPDPKIASNPYLMILAGWLIVVPSGALTFSLGLFDNEWSFNCPAELKPGGWKAVDVWVPGLIGWIYGALTKAHPVFTQPLDQLTSLIGLQSQISAKSVVPNWQKDEAKALCAVILTGLFAMRAIYNMGGGKEWLEQKRDDAQQELKQVMNSEKVTGAISPEPSVVVI